MIRQRKNKLLVTGASGFLGQAVVARAAAWELEAIAVSREIFHTGNATGLAAFLDNTRPDYAIDAAGFCPGWATSQTTLS